MDKKNICKITRLKLGLSQLEVSELIGVTNGTIHRWEAGKGGVPVFYQAICEMINRISDRHPSLVAKLSHVLNASRESLQGNTMMGVLFTICRFCSDENILDVFYDDVGDFDNSDSDFIEIMTHFKDQIKKRILDLPEDLKKVYMEPLSDLSSSIEKLKTIQDFEKSIS